MGTWFQQRLFLHCKNPIPGKISALFSTCGPPKYTNTWHLTITLLIQAVKRETNKYFATGTCFDQFYSHQKRWERVLAMGTCFDEFKLVKMRRERIYKNAFFGPLKACYGHKGLCTRWGRSHGFRKYP